MINGLLKNMNDISLKDITLKELVDASSVQEQLQQLGQPSKLHQPPPPPPAKGFLPSASSAAATISIANHDSNVRQQQQLYEALATAEVYDSQAATTVQYIAVHSNQPLPTTAHPASSNSMLSDQVDAVQMLLLQENQKLASIARVCIHLVDRCRNLNKSKQFTADLTKLSTMIEAFNSTAATNSSGVLPVISNVGGLVFGEKSTGQVTTMAAVSNSNGISSAPPTTSTNNQSFSSSQQSTLLPRSVGTVWMHLSNGNAPQSITQPAHFIHNMINEGDSAKALHQKELAKQRHEATQQQQQSENATGQDQKSILFKKLTESEPMLTTLKDAHSAAPAEGTSSGAAVGPMFLPNLLSDTAEQPLFSLVNGQIDNSNIENTPSNNTKPSKIYQCNICHKIFVSSYNLSRHSKSHTGFQAFECIHSDCRKRFSYSYHLKRHLETHTGQRNFVCTWPNCDQRFNRKYNLHRHLWVHTEHKNRQQQQQQQQQGQMMLLS